MIITILSASVAFVVCGMSAWILKHYFQRLRATRSDRRSGLLPLHVMSVAGWSIAALFRMIARDQYTNGPPPWWLGKPLTLLLALWLTGSLLLIVKQYGYRGPRLRHLYDRRRTR